MMKQDSLFLPYLPLNTTLMSETALFCEPDPDLNSGQILDWLEDSIPCLPSILDDIYGSTDIIDDPWWGLDLIDANTIFSPNNLTSTVSSTTTSPEVDLVTTYDLQHGEPVSEPSKKRKTLEDCVPAPQRKKTSGNKKGTGKSTKGDVNSGNKTGRWAEQLLNPCATAIANGNVTRVQHFLFVLKELASPTGDANYRLASHGMQALLCHLSSATDSPAKVVAPATCFATSASKFFQRSLINFNDINPWFTIPNNIANNAILQVLSEQDNCSCVTTLHILDIGVSHGLQWPTLLEALSSRPGGPPPLVRLTVVPPTTDNHQIPFANCPAGYDFASNILRYAKDVNVNLQINKLENCPLQNLNSNIINSSCDETLIVCAQFRLHSLNNKKPDNRTEFLELIRTMEPKGVILCDNNMDSDNKFDSQFSGSLDYLWSFLDSTSVAFKGRDMEERKLLEGEAAKALINPCEMNETKEKWGQRMTSVGFLETPFADDVVDQARALLRKYDNHWEMRADEKDGSLGLWWKGQSVSFCSLWKIDAKVSGFWNDLVE